MEWPIRGPAVGWWALTGTPGVGKSSVARQLPPDAVAVELGDLARGFGGRPTSGGGVEVDLARLGRFVRARRPGTPAVVVGYLSHRLPVHGTIVLRCHPRELWDRLVARGDSPASVAANVGSEALDLIAVETRGSGGPVVGIDTTGRPPASVARDVVATLAGRGPPSFGADWLGDPRVPELLMALER